MTKSYGEVLSVTTFCRSRANADNSFLETRDHKMIPNSEVEKALLILKTGWVRMVKVVI